MSAAPTLYPTPRLSGHRWLIIRRQPMPPPVLPLRSKMSREHVFPRWLRCTKCSAMNADAQPDWRGGAPGLRRLHGFCGAIEPR